jgi:hypothetical protein
MPWKFYEYVGGNGRSAVMDWIDGQPQGTRKRLKARLHLLLNELRLAERLDRSNGVGQLRHECAGLYELILFVDRIQFRPIGCYGPAPTGEFTLLAGAIEKGRRFTEPGICRTAHERRQRINDPRHVRQYRFD